MKKILKIFGVLVFWLITWQLVYFLVNQELLVASPSEVFFRLLELFGTTKFWTSTFFSIIRIMQGFVLAILFGVIFAWLTTQYKLFSIIFSPVLTVIKTTPVASFVVLALVFIKSFYVPSFISFLMVVPIIWANTKEGIKKTDVKLLEMAKVFNFNKFTVLRKIYIPSIMPHFMSAFTVGLGFAWKAGVAAEVIANTQLSIGSEIYISKIYMDTVSLFSWTIVVIIISLLLEKVIVKVTKKLVLKYNLER
ncbi:MAG: NitT/TauT family transport system permease protein [Eubacteriales bacterium SKADARSKE-1]|nr:NitT/TauT family transport system permease protein [Eubacteriales bacterium SKADARSKE-1]